MTDADGRERLPSLLRIRRGGVVSNMVFLHLDGGGGGRPVVERAGDCCLPKLHRQPCMFAYLVSIHIVLYVFAPLQVRNNCSGSQS